MPRYIGPYNITAANESASTYTLELPPDLRARGIHPVFHASRLRRHEPNDSVLFPYRESLAPYDLGKPEDVEWLVDEIINHRWDRGKLDFLVKWSLGDTTWEPYSECKDLEALDRYLELRGVQSWRALPRKEVEPV